MAQQYAKLVLKTAPRWQYNQVQPSAQGLHITMASPPVRPRLSAALPRQHPQPQEASTPPCLPLAPGAVPMRLSAPPHHCTPPPPTAHALPRAQKRVGSTYSMRRLSALACASASSGAAALAARACTGGVSTAVA